MCIPNHSPPTYQSLHEPSYDPNKGLFMILHTLTSKRRCEPAHPRWAWQDLMERRRECSETNQSQEGDSASIKPYHPRWDGGY